MEAVRLQLVALLALLVLAEDFMALEEMDQQIMGEDQEEADFWEAEALLLILILVVVVVVVRAPLQQEAMGRMVQELAVEAAAMIKT
jgi:hypothetical protein